MEKTQNQQVLEETEIQVPSSKSLFLVSSAIHCNHGIYSAEDRLQQTIKTCQSIIDRVPKDVDVDICILDGGTQELTEKEKELLKPYVDQFFEFYDNETIMKIQKINNWDIVKNMSEIVMYGHFYREMTNNIMSNYDRVFKMSGRYTLNEKFNYKSHLSCEEKIFIRGPYTSQFSSELTGGVRFQYMSRLWSFDSKLTPYISDTYKNMFDHMNHRLSEGGYIDIEHLLAAHLRMDLIVLSSLIGIEGNIAPNGVGISD
jgi:soluble P-type ATPase